MNDFDDFYFYTPLPGSDSNHRIPTFMFVIVKDNFKNPIGGCLRFGALPEIPLLWRRVNVDVSCNKVDSDASKFCFTAFVLFYFHSNYLDFGFASCTITKSCRKGKLPASANIFHSK